jgi:DNA-binding HxlR family transcriptional regulator
VSGPRRFVELQRVLPGISTEQLRSRLNRMVADGMLTRKRYREVPPRVDYELTDRARELTPILGELARWGYEWAWSSPRPGESIDLGAVFRLIPGLAGPESLPSGRIPSGRIELTVTDGHHGESITYLATMSPSGASLSEGEVTSKADAYLRGTQDAWVAALSPVADQRGLRHGGDRALADAVLELIAPARRRAAGEGEQTAASA